MEVTCEKCNKIIGYTINEDNPTTEMFCVKCQNEADKALAWVMLE